MPSAHGAHKRAAKHDGAVEQQPDDGNPDQRGERHRGVHAALGGDDDVAQALLRGDELADDGADHGGRRGDLERAQDVGQGVGDADLDEDLPFRRVEHAAEIEHVGLDLAQAHGGVDHHREEADQRAHQHVGEDAVAHPDQEQRRDRHLGQGVHEHQEGHQRIGDQRRPGDGHAQRHADAGRQEERADDLQRRDPEMLRPGGVAVPQRVPHRERRGQQVLANAADAHREPASSRAGRRTARRSASIGAAKTGISSCAAAHSGTLAKPLKTVKPRINFRVEGT